MMMFRFVHCYICKNNELDSDRVITWHLAQTVRKWCIHGPRSTVHSVPKCTILMISSHHLIHPILDTVNPMMVFIAFEVRTITHQPTQCIVS